MAQANPLQLERVLRNVAFPVTKPELLDNARRSDAEDDVFWSFERLPEQEFRTPSDVIHAVGRLSEKKHG